MPANTTPTPVHNHTYRVHVTSRVRLRGGVYVEPGEYIARYFAAEDGYSAHYAVPHPSFAGNTRISAAVPTRKVRMLGTA